MLSIEFHLHLDSLKARVCRVEPSLSLRYHSGFTRADSEAGWKQVSAIVGGDMSEAEIEAQKLEIVESARQYWVDLEVNHSDHRIVIDGRHLVWHELGIGAGFGGCQFIVKWIDESRAPLRCNLSAQGDIPLWMREQMPNNASSVTEIR